jgi:hypothetical protein
MRSHEARVGEAAAALRARLDARGIEDAAAMASDFVHDMLRNGWRPSARPVEAAPRGTGHTATPEQAHQYAEAARAALREQGRQLASERDDLIAAGVDPSELAIPIAPEEDA